MRRSFRLWAVLGCALPLSQLGHALAFEVSHPGRSPFAESRHGYAGPWFDASVALLGAVLLGVLVVVALARRAAGRRLAVRAGWPLGWILLALAAAQLEVYFIQELAEGTPAGEVLVPGLAGQLPVAVVAALALRWISMRFRRALRRLVPVPMAAGLSNALLVLDPATAALPGRAGGGQRASRPRGPPRLLLHPA